VRKEEGRGVSRVSGSGSREAGRRKTAAEL
jgi:hypothetical protein